MSLKPEQGRERPMPSIHRHLARVAFAAFAAVAIAATGVSSARAQPRFDMRATTTILPKTVLPTEVRLALDLDPALPTFGGEVAIGLRVVQPVSAIVLHAKELQAERAVLHSGSRQRVLDVKPGDAADTWQLVPKDGKAVAAGRHRLEIRYRGRVQVAGLGLYGADYEIDGRPARMLATQLEAVHARQLVPAFDEPLFRVGFTLEVRAPAGLEVLSNMPQVAALAQGSHTLHRFAPTPAMPTYLLAVAVGRFDKLEGRSDGVPLRIFTAPGKREQAQLAMAATQQVLPFYAQYFGRPYVLPKLDQLAVPSTRFGAMEDWGLISYAEAALLHDPASGPPTAPREVFSIVAHEIAHQWFGNLVSVASWNEIWLNEAFATWMQQKASNHFHPEWQTALGVRRSLDNTLARDATPATRAIRAGPVGEASVFEVFDGITYYKGGAVLTMLEQWVGPERFQRGLAAYMAERAMKPATAGDLWHHIGRVADKPLAEVAASWTDQPGVPLLEASASCQGGATALTLRQSRFSLGEPLPGGPWLVPVRLSRGGVAQTLLLRGPEQRIELPGCDDGLLLLNAGGGGYYRVEYDAALRARVVAAFAGLSPADRVAVLSDSFALASAGRQPLADHFALLRALPRVADSSRPALFTMALQQLSLLDVALHDSAAQAPFRAAAQALLGRELDRLGWLPAPGEDSEVSVLRAALIRNLALLGHAPTVAQARQRFAAAMRPGDAGAPASIRGAVLLAVGSDATAAEFDTLLAALRATQSQRERDQLTQALAAGRDPARAAVLMDEALSGRLPPDTSMWIPGAVAAQPHNAAQAYRFVVEHWPALARLGGEGAFGLSSWLLPGAASVFSDPAMAQTLLQDQQRLAGAAGVSTANTVAETIRARQRLRSREAGRLAEALAAWAPD